MQTHRTHFRSVRGRGDTVESAKLRDPRRFCQRACSSSGFTLLELLVVLAISLVIAAFAIPTLTVTLDSFRIRGALNGAANLTQKCRMQAIKSDLTQQLHFATVGNQVVLFVTDSTDGAVAPNPKDPQLHAQLWLPKDFSTPGLPTGGVAKLTANLMWGSNLAPQVNVDAFFNSRGLPCLPGGNGVCVPTTGFVYYFRYKGGGKRRWVAASISPAGRIQSWIWNGSTWEN